jgi:hypothetical protein
MTRMTLLAVALATAALVDVRPSEARYNGPWCAHMSMGRDFVENRCDMPSYEACRAEIFATPGTWCTENPYYVAPARASQTRRKPKPSNR